jgi:hypothetical protein
MRGWAIADSIFAAGGFAPNRTDTPLVFLDLPECHRKRIGDTCAPSIEQAMPQPSIITNLLTASNDAWRIGTALLHLCSLFVLR